MDNKFICHLFAPLYLVWNIFCFVAFIPALLTYKSALYFSRLWALGVLFIIEKIYGCRSTYIGMENVPPQGQGCIIASKHQSAWETIAPWRWFSDVCFVYKKELAYIPFFGWFHIAVRNIKVDRSAGAKALRNLLRQAHNRVANGRKVFLFPEGTRTPVGATPDYKSSIYAFYKDGIPVIPAALNSGAIWPKKKFLFLKPNQDFVISFLPQIPAGLSKKEFMEQIQTVIEAETTRLISELK